MREIWNKLAEKAPDAGELIEGVTKSGIRFLRSSVGRIPRLTSTAADDIDKDLEVDETHYLRVSLQALLSVYEEALPSAIAQKKVSSRAQKPQFFPL